MADATKRLHWSFDDPSVLTGTHDEKMTGVRKIRDEIRRKIESGVNKSAAPGRPLPSS